MKQPQAATGMTRPALEADHHLGMGRSCLPAPSSAATSVPTASLTWTPRCRTRCRRGRATRCSFATVTCSTATLREIAKSVGISATAVHTILRKHNLKPHLVKRFRPKDKTLHIVADNVSSHKTKEVQKYLGSRPDRFVIHYTPTHSSWLNLIERWFAELTTKRIRRESWDGRRQLEKAILDYIHHWNRSGRTLTWTKTAGEIMV